MIRNYSPSDIDKIIDIWLQASLQAHSFIPSEYWVSKQTEMKEVYIPVSQTFVYEDEYRKEIVGFVSMVDDYLAAIFVLPSEQGKGVGKALLDYVKLVNKKITLAVYAENSKSIDFYLKQGFRIIEEREEEESGEKELLMRFPE